MSARGDIIARTLLAIVLLSLGTHMPLEAQTHPMPLVPDSMATPSARADFAAMHYWEGFDFSDTARVQGDYGEQAFANFAGLLAYATDGGRKRAVSQWLALASATSLPRMAELAGDYLHAPASPLHNDTLYALVLQQLASVEGADEATRSRAAYQLQLLVSNQVGSVAADFGYTRLDGTEGRLNATAIDRLTLLLFYDPDCEQCQSLLFRLRHSTVLAEAIAQGRLAVLAVCTEGDFPSQLPATWLHVRAIESQPLPYDLQSLPSLYLLAADKRVLLRDPTPHALTQFLVAVP